MTTQAIVVKKPKKKHFLACHSVVVSAVSQLQEGVRPIATGSRPSEETIKQGHPFGLSCTRPPALNIHRVMIAIIE
jgi:hypothetical protein